MTYELEAGGRGLSQAEILARLSSEGCAEWIGSISDEKARSIHHDWDFWSRPDQRPPPGKWRTWLLLAGRGFGKTRAGAEWVRQVAAAGRTGRIGLVAATMAEARAIMVEGESGLLAIHPPDDRPSYEPSLGRVSWNNGVQAFLYSAAEPESLRGPQFGAAWADEIAKWPRGEDAWANLMFTMRMGSRPRIVATTTPRPVPLVRALVEDKATVVTRGATGANRVHLAPGFIAAIEERFGGTRLGRQEIAGELVADVEGSLWPRELFESFRVSAIDPKAARKAMRRIVVAVDPPAGAGKQSDACGIVVAGLAADGRAYVLADASVEGLRPEGWARAVARQYALWRADRIVAEANQGGEMVRSVLRAAGRNLPVKLVHAHESKGSRAEPVAAHYEMGRACHAGAFPALEDELAGMTIDGRYAGPGRSPDRADALVWAVRELLPDAAGEPRVQGL